MNDTVDALPGMARIRERFMLLLADRQNEIARHALAAWDATDSAVRNTELVGAQHILHQIAGTAGSLGFEALGQSASDCESKIIEYIDAPAHPSPETLYAIVSDVDAFVLMSQSLIEQHA